MNLLETDFLVPNVTMVVGTLIMLGLVLGLAYWLVRVAVRHELDRRS